MYTVQKYNKRERRNTVMKLYTYICCLGESMVSESLGWSLLTNAEKHGLDVSKITVIGMANNVQLRIYKESDAALEHIWRNISPREQAVITPWALEMLGFTLMDIGGECAGLFTDKLSAAKSGLVEHLATGGLQILFPEDFEQHLASGYFRTIKKDLFAPLGLTVKAEKKVLKLLWGHSEAPQRRGLYVR